MQLKKLQQLEQLFKRCGALLTPHLFVAAAAGAGFGPLLIGQWASGNRTSRGKFAQIFVAFFLVLFSIFGLLFLAYLTSRKLINSYSNFE